MFKPHWEKHAHVMHGGHELLISLHDPRLLAGEAPREVVDRAVASVREHCETLDQEWTRADRHVSGGHRGAPLPGFG